ncbi:MAG: efflux RND transporter permease subunit, partial [Candidatus Glassbacteria bacterium]
LPDISRPFLRVSVPYQGSNPEEVERLITRNVEEIMGTVPGLRSMHSNSNSSGSSVSLEFEQGTDMDIASMEVRERLDRVRPQLPSDLIDQPRVLRWQTTDWPILNFGVIWKGSSDQFENIVENVLEKRLMALDGVANVSIEGLKKKSIWVDLDEDQMRSSRVNSRQLSQQISSENQNLPAGYVYAGGRKYNLRAIGQFENVEQIADLPLNERGLRLSQVSNVRFDYPARMRWFSRLNGHDAVSIGIFKASNANIIEVNKRVQAEMEQIKADSRYSDLDYQIYWDQSESIVSSINNLKRAGLIGGVLAILVLLFFLGSLRNTLVIALAIPISMVTAIFFMYLSRLQPFNSDLTLNIISMMGMIFAIGIVIDPSIVVLENIFRIRKDTGVSALEASLEGSREVGMPILASIMTNVIVFVPLVFLGGGQGGMRFIRDFGVTFCVVCIASFVVAVTVVPLLTGKLIHNLKPSQERNFPGLRKVFTWLVSHALRYRVVTILIVLGIMWGVFALYGMMDKAPAGWQPDRRLQVSIRDISQNYSFQDASKILLGVEKELLDRKEELEIQAVGTNLNMGRRNSGRLEIYFKEAGKGSRKTEVLQEEVKKLIPQVPGFTFEYNRWHGGGGGGRGGGGGLEINLNGQNMETLAEYAKQVKALVQEMPGVEEVDLSTEEGENEVRVMVDRQRASTSGVSSSQVARTISSQLSSRPTSRFKSPQREIDIMVGLDEKDRVNLDGLRTMEIFSPNGQRVQLKNVANIETGIGPRQIEKNERLYNVEVSLESRSSGIYMLSGEVAQRMQQLSFAPGYTWDLGDTFRSMMEEESQSQFAVILALVLIYIVLASLFESFIHPFTILLSVPFAIIGVALIFVATKTNLDMMAYLGVILVCGLVVNNSIILIDYINLLRSRGMPRREAIIEGVQKRLRPILMTASTTILSLVPMTAPLLFPSLFGPTEGRAGYWGPVGLAIVGGMTTSTLLTLIITPTLYSLFDDLAL